MDTVRSRWSVCTAKSDTAMFVIESPNREALSHRRCPAYVICSTVFVGSLSLFALRSDTFPAIPSRCWSSVSVAQVLKAGPCRTLSQELLILDHRLLCASFSCSHGPSTIPSSAPSAFFDVSKTLDRGGPSRCVVLNIFSVERPHSRLCSHSRASLRV